MSDYRRPYLLMVFTCVLLATQALGLVEWVWWGTMKILAGAPDNVSRTVRVVHALGETLGCLFAIPTAAVFLAWLLAVQKNLKPLGSDTHILSPGKVIGGWFVPVFCFIHGGASSGRCGSRASRVKSASRGAQ